MKKITLSTLVSHILPLLLMAVLIVALCFFMDAKMDHLLTSDMSSEMVMAKLLADEGRLISPNWFYSTELHVLHTQLVNVPLFRFLNDWHQVRMAAGIILYLLLAGSVLYLFHCLEIKRPYWLIACLFFVPLSEPYFHFVVKGYHYIPYLSVTFLTVGALFQAGRAQQPRGLWPLLPAAVLALFSGMGGPRQVLMLYFPLFLANTIPLALQLYQAWSSQGQLGSILSWKASRIFRQTLYSGILLAFCCLGYLLNVSVISRAIHYVTWDTINFRFFNTTSLELVLNGILASLGYGLGPVFSGTLFTNLASLSILAAGLFFMVRFLKGSGESNAFILALHTLLSFLIFVGIHCFSDLGYADRYNLSVLVFLFPLIARGLQSLRLPRLFRQLLCLSFTGLVLLSGLVHYRHFSQDDNTAHIREAAAFLTQTDYREGYCTFWNANVLTELSNGQVEVWTWCDTAASPAQAEKFSSMTSVDDIDCWLQAVSHRDTPPQGPLFILLSRREFNLFPWKAQLEQEPVLFETSDGNYMIFGFESRTDLLNTLSD